MKFDNHRKEFETAEKRDEYTKTLTRLFDNSPIGFCPKISAMCRVDCVAYIESRVVLNRMCPGIGKKDVYTAQIAQAYCGYTNMFCSVPIE